MCMQISQFCSGSTKPLLFIGGLLLLILAVAIGYMGCTSHAIYTDINPQVADEKSLSYYLQLAAAGYLALVTLFSCYAAHTDQKHSIRALAIVSALNLVLAIAAITMMQPHQDVSKPFIKTLEQAAGKYDLTKGDLPQAATTLPPVAEAQEKGSSAAVNTSTAPPKTRRYADAAGDDQKGDTRDLTKEQATEIWDRLQARGCCGINKGNETWKANQIPKSCCAHPTLDGGNKICKEIDANHQLGCAALIDSTGMHLFFVLALIALVNFYLATISGISAYRTFHYNEANQSAYT